MLSSRNGENYGSFCTALETASSGKGLSQDALGEIIGVSNHAVSTYETGKNYPEVKKFFVLAEYFEVSLDYLAGWSDIREIQR